MNTRSERVVKPIKRFVFNLRGRILLTYVHIRFSFVNCQNLSLNKYIAVRYIFSVRIQP